MIALHAVTWENGALLRPGERSLLLIRRLGEMPIRVLPAVLVLKEIRVVLGSVN